MRRVELQQPKSVGCRVEYRHVIERNIIPQSLKQGMVCSLLIVYLCVLCFV
jgi:hypothetical protein